jgi:uncharacterized membrane protein
MDFKQAKRNKKIDIWLSIFLLITLFMCVNFIISKLKYSVDITKDSKYSLSPETIGRLNKTTDSIDVIITIPENNALPKIVQKLVYDLNLILNGFENAKTKHPIKIHRLNIDSAIPSSDLIQK